VETKGHSGPSLSQTEDLGVIVSPATPGLCLKSQNILGSSFTLSTFCKRKALPPKKGVRGIKGRVFERWGILFSAW
jgi:hypothetical protein